MGDIINKLNAKLPEDERIHYPDETEIIDVEPDETTVVEGIDMVEDEEGDFSVTDNPIEKNNGTGEDDNSMSTEPPKKQEGGKFIGIFSRLKEKRANKDDSDNTVKNEKMPEEVVEDRPSNQNDPSVKSKKDKKIKKSAKQYSGWQAVVYPQYTVDEVQPDNTILRQYVGKDQKSNQTAVLEETKQEKEKNKKGLVILGLIGAAALGLWALSSCDNDNLKEVKRNVAEIFNDKNTLPDDAKVVKDNMSTVTTAKTPDGTPPSTQNIRPRQSGINIPDLNSNRGGDIVKAIKNIDSSSVRQAYTNILNNRDKHDELSVSHAKNKVNSLEGVKPDTISIEDIAEAHALGILNSREVALASYNDAIGLPTNTPSKHSHKWLINYLTRHIQDNSTTYSMQRVSGNFANTGIHDGKNITEKVQYFDNLRVFKISFASGQDILLKVGGGTDASGSPCLNNLRRVQVSKTPAGHVVMANGGVATVYV